VRKSAERDHADHRDQRDDESDDLGAERVEKLGAEVDGEDVPEAQRECSGKARSAFEDTEHRTRVDAHEEREQRAAQRERDCDREEGGKQRAAPRQHAARSAVDLEDAVAVGKGCGHRHAPVGRTQLQREL